MSKLKNYFKYIVFYLTNMLSTIINFVCSLFGYYPQLELGVSFLVILESKRILSELDFAVKKKQDQLDNADEKVKIARELDNGKD